MSATDVLRKDHQQIDRLDKLICKCYQSLYDGKDIPLEDIEKITVIISEFLDSIHYSREEDSYFACVASYGSLKEEIRKLMIEHEFSRNIARSISKHLQRWKKGEDAREPVARFLRTYSIYLQDHKAKEEDFFDKAEAQVLSKEEEQEMYEYFLSEITTTKKIDDMIQQISLLEKQIWFLE